MHAMPSPLWPLLRTFSWEQLRHHPWRNAAAVVSIMLGVALALAVQLINASALDEFAQAVRSVNGQPDVELRARDTQASLSEALFARLLHHPDVALASPVLEVGTYALGIPAAGAAPAPRVWLRVVAVDALQVAAMAPDLLPQPTPGTERLAMLAPDAVFLNASARAALAGERLQLLYGLQRPTLRVAGRVQASGSPLAVMDIGAAQDLFDKRGQLTRVDLRLRAGVAPAAFMQALQAQTDWPAQAYLAPPGQAVARIGNLSRAYRMNLSVLALVALFTGSFLVFSVMALSVTRRLQEFALLGVLGLTGGQRLRLVLLEAAALGAMGSALGMALGTALAALALRLLGGDLGGGYFSDTTPALQWSGVAALVFAALGLAAALAGAWWPARLAQRLAPAQALKGLGQPQPQGGHAWAGLALLVLGGLLALLPPVAGIPLAAYASVALLLVGGITALPWLVGAVLDRLAPLAAHHALPLLALERARRVRASASVAVSSVVASLSLAVALTVMVASFRSSVEHWLDTVLPAALYVRTAHGSTAAESVFLDPALARSAAALKGVDFLRTQRTQTLVLEPAQPPVTLIARPLHQPGSTTLNLPLVGEALAVPEGQVGIYVSEAMVDLYGARLGHAFPKFSVAFRPLARVEPANSTIFFVAGVWRDYARQFGSVAMEQADFERLGGDTRVTDIAFWLTPDAQATQVEQALRQLANTLAHTPGGEAASLLEFGTASAMRASSLRIFDRSFAVTYWLQAVAIGIGLFGVAASFSAQVLARRKEFGLLVHLGLTRQQVLRVVAAEGTAWTTLGTLAGTGLGLAVALVLVRVVNPQSFHWSMDLVVPWAHLLALGLAVVSAGTATAWLAGRAAASRDAVLAVKEDW